MLAAAAAVAAFAVAAPVALAHIERSAYWPGPGVDGAVAGGAGGKVPETRGLFSALKPKPVGNTLVVCATAPPRKPKGMGKGKVKNPKQKKARRKYAKRLNRHPSIKALRGSVKRAKKKKGYVLRPSQPKVEVKKKYAKKLIKFNTKLLKRCRYREIQPAVTDARNNDRVVILPGTYTEPTSRAQPTNDPKCDGMEEVNDKGQTGALSYLYQLNCPNDQNLIAVMGRSYGGSPPDPPLANRRGLPDEGKCIRCNLQIEGSGLTPDDVIIDAGDVASGNGGPANPVKDVVLRADRADGFVARNINVRHAAEHGIYVVEVDGYRLEQWKGFWNEEYAFLGFTADHGLIQDCDAAGSGDSALYPGASPETGEQIQGEPAQRYNTEIRECDMHHNAAGYSGTDANAVWVHHNEIYDNANGFTTDVFSAAGHPGFPQDSDLIEHNRFYSNNFNPYEANSDVDPTVPMPVGTGMWIAGGNNNVVRNNHFYDNWRRGTMLFSVPNSLVGGCVEGRVDGCNPLAFSTSYRNRHYGNKMGVSPSGQRLPNGTDFWWDQQGINPPGQTANCWFGNTGKDGTAASVTSVPAGDALPSDCSNSLGGGGVGFAQVAELLGCVGAEEVPGGECNWFTTPPRPAP